MYEHAINKKGQQILAMQLHGTFDIQVIIVQLKQYIIKSNICWNSTRMQCYNSSGVMFTKSLDFSAGS